MAHIHDRIDYTSDVFIVNGGAVLLRFHDKYDAWLPPGGHIELDEDPEEAALREVMEEVGLPVTLVGERAPNNYSDSDREILVPRFVNRHPVSDTHEHIAFIYFGTSTKRDIHPHPDEKEVEIRWFTKEELDDAQYGIWDRVRDYAKAALEALS